MTKLPWVNPPPPDPFPNLDRPDEWWKRDYRSISKEPAAPKHVQFDDRVFSVEPDGSVWKHK